MGTNTTTSKAAERFAPALQALGAGTVEYRQTAASREVTHVLLHGIGSGSVTWSAVLDAFSQTPGLHALAWDAPGYGRSTPLDDAVPSAADYATVLWAWLDAMQIDSRQPLMLVGHSLGALIAAAAARQRPDRVARLLLVSPAQGYANAAAGERHSKLEQRLRNLRELGPAGIARTRSATMVSATASDAVRRAVEQTMAQINPAGYTQAAQMLANGDLESDLRALACPVWLASGSADVITPPTAIRELARQLGLPYHNLGPVGHACLVEAPAAVLDVVERFGAQ